MMPRTSMDFSRRRRGSVFILVVAVLSVLVLLTLTLSYVSRMDLLASRNWGNTVQSRMAAVTGIPAFKAGSRPGIYNGTPTAVLRDTVAPGATEQTTMMARGLGRRPSRMATVGTVPPQNLHGPGAMTPSAMTPTGLLTDAEQDFGEVEPFSLNLELDRDSQAGMPALAYGPASTLGTARSNLGSTRLQRMGRRTLSGSQRRGATGAPTTVALGGIATEAANEDAAEALATAQIEDESAKININAVEPAVSTANPHAVASLNSQGTQVQEAAGAVNEEMLVRLVERVAVANHINGVDARSLAHWIAMRRYGADGRPGKAYADDNANNGYTDPSRDGADNDRDGLIDESDELQAAMAHDGLDNNHNGVIDESGESIAQDGLDNNRNGQVDEGSEAVDDPAEASSDPRRPAWGDDLLYGSLEELMGLPGMTPALYKALTPYLTTFSVAFAAFNLEENQSNDEAATGFPQVDPNSAPPELLYQVLQRRFPEADEDLLGQFIANLIDRRDPDNVPTTIRVGERSYTGMEITPFINEICPDPSAGENNDGQFVEIYNPWNHSFTLTGWSLRGGGLQAPLNGTLPPNGFLVLTNDINNENDPSPEDEGAEGSFYNVFHKVGTGGQRQLVEIQGLQLPADSGKVQLVNPEGLVVDEFEYQKGSNTGALRSFQRKDPRLRYTERMPATPLESNIGMQLTEAWAQVLRVMEQWQNQPLRSPLDAMLVSTAYVASAKDPDDETEAESPAGDSAATGGQGRMERRRSMQQLNNTGGQEATGGRRGSSGRQGAFRQSGTNGADAADAAGAQTDAVGQAAFTNTPLGEVAASETSDVTGASEVHAFVLPQLNDASGENLDVRLVDCFRIGATLPPSQSAGELNDQVGTLNGLEDATGLAERTDVVVAMAGERAQLPVAPRCEAVYGRINLNTAPLVVLAALPGMDQTMLSRIADSRGGESRSTGATGTVTTADWAWWIAESPFAHPRWRNLSDFLQDETLWVDRPLYDRLDAVYPYCQLVTMHTQAVRVATSCRIAEDAPAQTAPAVGSTQTTRRPTLTSAERIIAGDRGAPETVVFTYAGIGTGRQIDPDAQYAAPAGTIKPVDVNALLEQVRAAGGKVGDGSMRAPVGSDSGAGSTSTPSVNTGTIKSPGLSARRERPRTRKP